MNLLDDRNTREVQIKHGSLQLSLFPTLRSPGGFGVDGGRGFVEGGLGFELLEVGVRGGGGGGRGLDAPPLLVVSCGRRLLPVSVCARAGAGPLGGLGRGLPFDEGLSPDDDRP